MEFSDFDLKIIVFKDQSLKIIYINHLKKEPVIAKFSDFILIFEPCVIKDITITGNVGGCTLYFGGGMSTTTTKVYEKYYKLNNNVIQKIIVN